MSNMTFTLKDSTGHEVKGEVSVNGHVLELKFEGYGDFTSQPGHGSPCIIDLYENELRLVAWPEIDSEDAEIISLAGAKETPEMMKAIKSKEKAYEMGCREVLSAGGFYHGEGWASPEQGRKFVQWLTENNYETTGYVPFQKFRSRDDKVVWRRKLP